MTKSNAWTDRYHYSVPMDRFIIGRLPDGSEATVQWNPLKQSWEDFYGKPCNNWEVWREITDD